MSDDELNKQESEPVEDTEKFGEFQTQSEEPQNNPTEPTIIDLKYSVSNLELLAILVLTVFLDYLLFQGSGGLSYTIILLFLPIAIYFCAPDIKFSRKVFIFYSLFVLLAIRCFWQVNPAIIIISVCTLIAFSISLKTSRYDVPFISNSFFPTLVIGIGRLFDDYLKKLKTIHVRKIVLKPSMFKTIGIPVLITAVFGLIFILANKILSDLVTRVFNSFWNDFLGSFFEKYFPGFNHILFWLICLWFLATLFRPYVRKLSRDEEWCKDKETEPEKVETENTVPFRVSFNTLIGVNLIFFVYNCIDAYYLLGKSTLPAGLNHSQYAHQGAFWLTVALALSTFILGAIFRDHLNFHLKVKSLYTLTVLWGIQNFILALWVYQRLVIYINYNGLTRMRIVGILGTTLVIVGFILVLLKVNKKWTLLWLIRKQLAALAFTVIFIFIIPMDLIVWNINAKLLSYQDAYRTAVQLAIQPISPEGLPSLVPLLEHEDPVIAKGTAAILGKWYYELRYEGKGIPGRRNLRIDRRRSNQTNSIKSVDKRWTEYQLTHEKAIKAVSENTDKINELLPDRNWDEHLINLKRYTERWI